MGKNPSLEANLAAAKAAARQMRTEWAQWRSAKDASSKSDSIAKYAAAYTSCKVYIENYLKHRYPDGKVPPQVWEDIRALVADMEAIEKVNETMLQKVCKDIEQIQTHAA
jgi:hypothetical protein